MWHDTINQLECAVEGVSGVHSFLVYDLLYTICIFSMELE